MRNHRTLLVLCLPFLLCAGHGRTKANLTETLVDEVPKEVRDLKGTYTGSWTNFGIDDKGQVIPRSTWTDTLEADQPQVEGERAFVITAGEMVFAGAKIPPLKVRGREGYFLKKGGGLGDYFIETFGQVYRMHKIGDNVWTYAAPADPRELAALGFANVATAQHVLVKVVNREQGTETHRITRVTTVNWKDKEGKERWLQYVSLQGFHKRAASQKESGNDLFRAPLSPAFGRRSGASQQG